MTDLTLADFLRARIANDERAARALTEHDRRPVLSLAMTVNHPDRLLAECEAKRRIVERETAPRRMRPGFPYVTVMGPDGQSLIPEWAADHGASLYSEYAITDPDGVAAEIEAWSDPIVDTPILRLLALPYADHPDYDERWRV